jgi:hypothetical protein
MLEVTNLLAIPRCRDTGNVAGHVEFGKPVSQSIGHRGNRESSVAFDKSNPSMAATILAGSTDNKPGIPLSH